MQRGHSGTLYVDVQNDGLVADSLKVTGPGGAHGFTVGYYRGATNVTPQVHAGTFSTGSIAPGAHVTLRVLIKVVAGSNSSTRLPGHGQVVSWAPSMPSSDRPRNVGLGWTSSNRSHLGSLRQGALSWSLVPALLSTRELVDAYRRTGSGRSMRRTLAKFWSPNTSWRANAASLLAFITSGTPSAFHHQLG